MLKNRQGVISWSIQPDRTKGRRDWHEVEQGGKQKTMDLKQSSKTNVGNDIYLPSIWYYIHPDVNTRRSCQNCKVFPLVEGLYIWKFDSSAISWEQNINKCRTYSNNELIHKRVHFPFEQCPFFFHLLFYCEKLGFKVALTHLAVRKTTEVMRTAYAGLVVNMRRMITQGKRVWKESAHRFTLFRWIFWWTR